MRITCFSRRRGIALIIVMVMIVTLGILAGGFAYRMKVETTLARRATFTTDLDWAARSGVEVAKWVLGQSLQGPDGRTDSLKQKWAGGPGSTNDILSGIDLKNYPLLRADGSVAANLSIDIQDMDRKFNINVVRDDLLMEAMTLIGVDAAESRQIANAILDWRDVDKDPGMGGAEDDYYQRQDPPYSAKNGPIDDLSELLLIKGISPAMYHGSGSAAGGDAAPIIHRRNSARDSHFEEPSYAVGFADLFTPLSSRMVNINTASETVLQMIPGIEYDIAQAIIRGGPYSRAGMDGVDGTEDDMPYVNIGELTTRVPQLQQLPPGALQLLSQYLTTRSLVFEARVSIDIGGTKRDCVAILRRNGPKDVQTLNMYWKS